MPTIISDGLWASAVIRPAADAIPSLADGADDQSVPAAVAVTVVTAGYDMVLDHQTAAEPPLPDGQLLKRLGRAEAKLAAVPWTAGLVRQALGVYAGYVSESAEWLTRTAAVALTNERKRLTRELKRLAVYIAGLEERRRRSPGWAVADRVLPGAGRDERIARYEAHLHKLLTTTLHELERVQAARAGRPGLPPLAVDVTVVEEVVG